MQARSVELRNIKRLGQLDMAEQSMAVGKFYHLLQACMDKKDVDHARKVHDLIIKHGYASNAFLGTHLIRTFAICGGSLLEANQVFRSLSRPTHYTWLAMISTHTMLGQGEQALNLYFEMHRLCLHPGQHVFAAALKACSSISSLDHGLLVHTHIVEDFCEFYAYIGSTLIDMYAKCGSLTNARRVFDRLPALDLVTWSAMMSGYALHKHGYEALQLFQQMEKAGIEPDGVTYVSGLKACSQTNDLEHGKVIHGVIVKNGCESDVFVGSTLVDMYNGSGKVGDARKVFNQLPKRNVVTWSAMLSGYALYGPGEEALRLFKEMLQDGVEPNGVTCVSLLKACSSITALHQGRLIHSLIIESTFESHKHVGSTLVDLYAKCGRAEDSQIMFDNLSEQNVVTWNTLIAGYGELGDHSSTLHYFKCMQQKGLKPNDVSFVCLLTACSHLGLLKEACEGLQLLTEDNGFTLVPEHVNCMVDLLGRLGRTNEAEDLLKVMPFHSSTVGWSALLCHCHKHGKMDLAKFCFNQVEVLGGQDSSNYAIMTDVLVDAELLEEATRFQELKDHAYAWKMPGKALIEVDNKAHDFVVGDKSHPYYNYILLKLRQLDAQLKQAGYFPHVSLEWR